MATGGTDASVVGLGEGGMQWVPPFQLKNGSGTEMFGVDVSGNVTFAGTSTIVSSDNITVTNTAPSVSLRDSTGSAKDLIISVDANVAHMYEESAGSAGQILSLDLANNRVGIATAAPTVPLDVTGAAAISTTLAVGGVATFSANPIVTGATPGMAFTDTTGSAKSLTIAVDGNKAQLRESAGAAGSLIALDLANNRVGIGAASPLVPLEVKTAGAIYHKFGESVALADDASLTLETSFGSTGMYEIVCMNALAYGKFLVTGAGNTATLLDTGLLADDADTDTKLCVIADGDGTYSLKNRLGSSLNFAIRYVGL